MLYYCVFLNINNVLLYSSTVRCVVYQGHVCCMCDTIDTIVSIVLHGIGCDGNLFNAHHIIISMLCKRIMFQTLIFQL